MEISTFDFNGLHRLVDGDLKTLRKNDHVIWIDMVSPTIHELTRIQQAFNLHPLAIEDTRNEHQRPKVEEYADHVFIITNNIILVDNKLQFQEIDIFLGRNYIITIHGECQHVMQDVRTWIRQTGTFKHVSSEYLLYVLLDAVVDAYFPILDKIDDEIEDLGEAIIQRPTKGSLKRLFELKRMLNEAWHVAGLERDMFSTLTRREADLITHHDVLEYHLRDVYDHLQRISDVTGVLRENLNNLIDLYATATSNRLNVVVNRLSIITIVIGILTVFSGFYGMNFEHTWPPFGAEWGVPFVLFGMAALSAGLLALLKWLDFY